ncbi:MAG: helicase SNF2 [Planctomycetota bacterium]|nr:MAG: helicase SNF2 [Planctomycetota bacterium]
MIGIWASIAAALFGGSTVAHRVSGVSRSARRARKAVRATGDALQDGRRELVDRRARLELAGGAYAEAARERARAQTPVEDLRDLGAQRVRWAAVNEAGIHTLAQLREFDAQELDALPGVGEASAKRLLDAAKLHEERLARRAAPAPDDELSTPHAASMVQRADEWLDGKRQLDRPMAELEREQLDFVGRMEQVRRKSGFARWIGTALIGRSQADDVQAAEALSEQAEASLRDGVAARVQAARAALAEAADTAQPTPELRARWREARAELASVLDLVLAPEAQAGGDLNPDAGARLPSEVVDAVSACVLRSEGLALVLRRYQDFGARYMVVQERSILGDDMGLGKTVQALAAAVHLSQAEGARRVLVVAPATVVPNWLKEIERFTDLPSQRLHGAERDIAAARWLRDGGVAVSSYSTLRTMELAAQLTEPVDLLIADEAHFLKNPEASRTQAVAALLPAAKRVCLMTGTPIENSLDEFRALLRLVRPDMPEAQEPDPAAPAADPQVFQRAVAAAYLRRNQRDVLHELPDRLEKQEWVELDGPSKSAYREAVQAGNIMAMRRVATVGDWQRATREQTGSKGVPDSSKIRRIVDLAAEHAEAGRKLLVFSFFLDVLDALAKRLDPVGVLHGGVSPDERQAMINDFSAREGSAVLLGQITAAGVGLNLQAASVVILAEPQWKPSVEEQAIARAHRMGQTEKVVVHRLLARDSVDERIVELLEDKRELFDLYARESAVKEAAADASEGSLAKMVVEVEQARLEAEDEGANERGASRGADAAVEPDPHDAELDEPDIPDAPHA